MRFKILSSCFFVALTSFAGGMTTHVAVSDNATTATGRSSAVVFDTNRPLCHDSDPAADGTLSDEGLMLHYMGNRRALAGDGCHVNMVHTEVGVASVASNLQNLTDEDLSNSASFIKGVKVDLVSNPYVSVRDVNHYYAKGTEAGFCIVASTGANVLTIDVVKLFHIGFYRDGKLIGTEAVDTGADGTGLGVSLIQIPGSDDAAICVSAVAPDIFDEISLTGDGISIDTFESFKIKYAFVGKERPNILNRDWKSNGFPIKGGISAYNELSGRSLKLVDAKCNNGLAISDKFVENPEEGALIAAVVTIGGCSAEVHIEDEANADSEVFDAGTEVGFKIGMSSLLELGVGDAAQIIFYSKDKKTIGYTETERVTVNAGVLGLDVADITPEQFISATASKPFSGAKLYLGKGLEVNLGSTMAYYAYFKEKPDVLHHCDLAHSSRVYLAPDATECTLQWNKTLGYPVEWTLVEAPEGSTATVDSSTGLLSGIDLKGEYVLRVQVLGEGHEECNGEVIVKNDQFRDEEGGMVAGGCGNPLVNGIENGTYEVQKAVYESSGSLISISNLENENNVVSPDFESYATYNGGLGIATNVRIIGVKRTDGTPISDGSAAVRVGFVVEESVNGLNANVLEFMQIRTYYAGNQTESKPVDESNAVSVDLIGSGKTRKVRYSIEVPAGKMFDEIQLWKSGVLNLDVNNLKIYYPFVEEAGSVCSTILGCDGELVSLHASVMPLMAGGVNAFQFIKDLSFFIDNDLDSYMAIGNTVSLGGGVNLSVKLGRTIDPSQQIGIIVGNETYLAGVNAGEWLKVRLKRQVSEASSTRAYKAEAQSEYTGDEFTDWSVADANVAGFGDKNVLHITPTKPFDEIEMVVANVVGAVDYQKFYGICTKGDSNGNGIPDCMETSYEALPDVPTGVASPERDTLEVRVAGSTVTASCGAGGIERVIVYDMAGMALDGAVCHGGNECSIDMAPGIYIVYIMLSDGSARSVKVEI